MFARFNFREGDFNWQDSQKLDHCEKTTTKKFTV